MMVVLMYHSVKSEQRSQFERHLNEILKLGHVVSADTNSLNNLKNNIAVTFDDGFQNILNNALPLMQQKKIPATIFIPTGYLGKKPGWINNPLDSNANELLMTEEQLKALPNNLIAIGSHTVSHQHLKGVKRDTLIRELIDSKSKLESLLCEQITLLSLPYGSFDKKHTELYKEVGYKRIFLNIPTFPASKTDSYVIGRISVSFDDWLIEYRLKLLGAYQWLPFAINTKNKIKSIIGFIRSE